MRRWYSILVWPVLLLWPSGCGGSDAGGLARPTVQVEVVPATPEECPLGGQKVLSGIDGNQDGTLQPAEVEQEVLNCATEGRTPLSRTAAEPPGDNCAGGGTRLDTGLDRNGDDALDDDEVTSTVFICGGLSTVVRELPPGPQCPSGGRRIDSGVDLNQDGVLSEDEITESSLDCDPPPIVVLTEALPPASRARVYVARVEGTSEVTGALRWEATSPLPAGLRLRTEDGVALLEGVPTELGSHELGLRATNALDRAVEASFNLEVRDPLRVETLRLLALPVDAFIDEQLIAAGGTPPYSFRRVGPIPPGLALDADGRLTGTLARGFNADLLIEVEDAQGNAVRAAVRLTTEMQWAVIRTLLDEGWSFVPLLLSGPPVQAQSLSPAPSRSLFSVVSGFSPGGDRFAARSLSANSESLTVFDLRGERPFRTELSETEPAIIELRWSPSGQSFSYRGQTDSSFFHRYVELDGVTGPVSFDMTDESTFSELSPFGAQGLLGGSAFGLSLFRIVDGELMLRRIDEGFSGGFGGPFDGWTQEGFLTEARTTVEGVFRTTFFPFDPAEAVRPIGPAIKPAGLARMSPALDRRFIQLLEQPSQLVLPVNPQGTGVRFRPAIEAPTSARWSLDGEQLLSQSFSLEIQVAHIDRGGRAMAISPLKTFGIDLQVSRSDWVDEGRIWVQSDAGPVWLWDVERPEGLMKIADSSRFSSVVFSPNGDAFFGTRFVDAGSETFLARVSSPNETLSLGSPGQIQFSADGRFLVYTSRSVVGSETKVWVVDLDSPTLSSREIYSGPNGNRTPQLYLP